MNIEGQGEIDRFCILATGDKHPGLECNLRNVPIDIYLRDSECATQVRGYMDAVQAVEGLCFGMPAEPWVLAQFALHGAGIVVTAEVNNEPVAAQYVSQDGWGQDRLGVRLFTTVVHPELRRLYIASMLTAISFEVTRTWATFGSTLCDTDSSLMGRNARLRPLVVTANMRSTPGRRKVHLEWKRPEDPFNTLFQTIEEDTATIAGLPQIDSLMTYDMEELPPQFRVTPHAEVWEDIALNPNKYRRYFRLTKWLNGSKMMVLEKPTEDSKT